MAEAEEKPQYPTVWTPMAMFTDGQQCWADNPGLGRSIVSCYERGQGPLGLCPKHHLEIVGPRS